LRASLVLLFFVCVPVACRNRTGEPIGPGSILRAHSEQGATLTLRIDAVERDPRDADGDVYLYEASMRDPADGQWKPFCRPDRAGKNRAIPLQGSWDAARNHVASDDVITFACTSGALGKCVLFGYKPWKTLRSVSLADYYRACAHVVIADYCGDGRAHTREGTLIDVYDRLGIQKREPAPDMVFEAAWSPAGAVYINKPRYSGERLEELVQQCPDRLRGRTSRDEPLDAQAVLERWPDALIVTESRIVAERP
jgi:hypothetical protein